jgi:phosphinothricin acetyltransferase
MAGLVIEPLTPVLWPLVAVIYLEGIVSGNATFETQVPTWEDWDTRHLPHKPSGCRGEW